MSDAEDDDYLSEKFLSEAVAPASSKSTLTYAERRRQALRISEHKNVQNRKKSRRELEEESLREGLSKSLFERADDNSQIDISAATNGGNKAMAMMFKMGYKPGQSLGVSEHGQTIVVKDVQNPTELTQARSEPRRGHLIEPIQVEIRSGRAGVGKRKRDVSPTTTAKLAKLVKESVDKQMQGSYRERTRTEYEEKRAEGRLHAARQTCISLDEKTGSKKFNVYWLDPQDPESFPSDLLQILTSHTSLLQAVDGTISQEERLKKQMQADALQPVTTDLEDEEAEIDTLVVAPSASSTLTRTMEVPIAEWPKHVLEEVKTYILTDARTRLKMLLNYLRSTYFYCFWCGTQYEDAQDMQENCPGSEEEDH